MHDGGKALIGLVAAHGDPLEVFQFANETSARRSHSRDLSGLDAFRRGGIAEVGVGKAEQSELGIKRPMMGAGLRVSGAFRAQAEAGGASDQVLRLGVEAPMAGMKRYVDTAPCHVAEPREKPGASP